MSNTCAKLSISRWDGALKVGLHSCSPDGAGEPVEKAITREPWNFVSMMLKSFVNSIKLVLRDSAMTLGVLSVTMA